MTSSSPEGHSVYRWDKLVSPHGQLRFAIASFFLETEFDPSFSLPLVAARILPVINDSSDELVELAGAANDSARSELISAACAVCINLGIDPTDQAGLYRVVLPHWLALGLDKKDTIKYSKLIYEYGFNSSVTAIAQAYSQKQWEALIGPYVLDYEFDQNPELWLRFEVTANKILWGAMQT